MAEPRCPICRKPAPRDGNPASPFCSERCRLIDLGRWLGGEYRVPDDETPVPDGDGEAERDGEGRSKTR